MTERDQELNLRQRLSGLSRLPLLRGVRVNGESERLERQLQRLQADTSDEAIWRSVELARHPERPYTLDYVERMIDDWVELLLQPVGVAGQPRAPKERQSAQLVQPLAEMSFVFTGHC